MIREFQRIHLPEEEANTRMERLGKYMVESKGT